MTRAVERRQRFSRSQPCPVCAGYDNGARRGQGERCFGFLSDDGKYAHCTRPEDAGGLPLSEASQTYAHYLAGTCRCGKTHGLSATPIRLVPARHAKRVQRRVFQIKGPDGTVVAEHVRDDYADGTKVCWWRRNGKNTLGDLPLTELPLFGSERLAALAKGTVVIVTEGEPAAEILWTHRFAAVATVTGAGTIPCDSRLEVLRDFEVVLWPDDDDKGQQHMRRIAERLGALGITVRWLRWSPGVAA
jgi:hypothetical protein